MNRWLAATCSLVLLAALPARLCADQTDIESFSSASGSVNNATSLAVGGVASGGPGKYLLAGVSLALGTSSVSGVTFDAGSGPVALTRLAFQASPNTNVRVEIWGLVAPADAGAGTVTVTCASATDIVCGVAVLNNVDTTTPVVSTVTDAGNGTGPTLATAASTRQAIFDALAADNSSTTVTPVSPQTELWNLGTAGASGGGTETGAGGVQAGENPSVAWTLSANRRWAAAAVVLQAAPGLPTAVRYRSARATVRRARDANGTGATPGGSRDRVRVRWSTAFERDNLGFRVLRQDAAGRRVVSPGLIAGSAFMLRGRALPRGRSYAFDDPGPVDRGARYYVEDVELSGRRTLLGPIAVEDGADDDDAGGDSTVASPLLNDLSGERRRARHRARARGARPPLGGALRPMTLTPFVIQPPAPTSEDLAVQRRLAALGAVKIRVREGGRYVVGAAELHSAGVPADVDPRTLQLFANGREVALVVRAADARGLADGDALEFYGAGQDVPSTGVRTYWLTWGHGRGRRVHRDPGMRSSPPGPAATSSTLREVVERADRWLYVPSVRNGGAENFFGDIVMAEPVEQALEVPHPAPGEARLTVRLQGFSDHHAVAVALNGRPLGVLQFAGAAAGEATYAVPAGVLADGENVVRLTGSSDEDVTAVISLRLEYERHAVAQGDALRLTAAGGRTLAIRGFTTDRLRVLDVTDPWVPVELAPSVAADGAGTGFRLALTAPGSGERTLLVFADDVALAPESVRRDAPSDWTASRHAGAFLAIAHADVLSALEPLRARRAAQHGSAAVVDVTDLYDELSFGDRSTRAIRDFLSAAARWRVPPRYVLLAGDATFDPRNHTGAVPPGVALVPTRLVDTASLETSTDDWFTDADGDGGADLPIGRLPVRTAAEAETVVAKLLAHDDSAEPARARRSVLIADAADGESDFEAACALAAAALPDAAPVLLKIGTLGRDAVRASALSALAEGLDLLVYFGHASQEQWAEPGVLFASDALPAAPRTSLVLSMTCLTGLFHDVYVECLAEQWLRAVTGPVAVWASTGFPAPGAQPALARAFLEALTTGATIGEAAVAAKRTIGDRDARATWTLFGDPSLRVY